MSAAFDATRVLVIGAGGVFGSRLAEGLARAGFDLVVAGRDLTRAEATAADLRGRIEGARVSAIRLDTRDLNAADLAATGATIVVDAAGPFQNAEPRVARAAIAAGLSYVDLADARDFVAAFPALDAQARAAGVVALTGASSTPALSHAVLNHLTAAWQRIDSVEAAISPGARAPRGRSVTEAILSWLGRPVRVFEHGGWRVRPGWSGLERCDFGTAGRRWLSLCETPDLDLLPERFRPTDRAVFLAGLEPAMAHWGAWALGWMARRIDADLARFAPAVIALSRLAAPFGDDRGAMRVEAVGLDATGQGTRTVWTLVAPPGVGPFTPGLPALAAVKALAAGRLPPGARACVADLSLAKIEAEMVPHGIETTVAAERSALFARAIGPAFEGLPEPLRALHEAIGQSVWRGEAVVEGPATPLAGLAARLFGFPPATPTAPVEVQVDADGTRSIWRRRIGGHRFHSVLSHPRAGGRVVERFGPLSFDLVLTRQTGRLLYAVVGWRLGPIRMPTALAPTTRTHEAVDAEGRFTFDVEIGLPWGGRMVRYRGWLARDRVSTPHKCRDIAGREPDVVEGV